MKIGPPMMKERQFPSEIPEPVLAKLIEKTIFSEDCWLFSSVNTRGHGQLRYEGRSQGVHRLIAHFCHGLDLSNASEQANHKMCCPNRNCWNPEHIYVGNQSENTKDAVLGGTYNNQNTMKTHCKKGHLLSGDNLMVRKDGGRNCRICVTEYLHIYNTTKRNKPPQATF